MNKYDIVKIVDYEDRHLGDLDMFLGKEGIVIGKYQGLYEVIFFNKELQMESLGYSGLLWRSGDLEVVK